jgi:Domain of unknown function (DUF1735)/PKD domain
LVKDKPVQLYLYNKQFVKFITMKALKFITVTALVTLGFTSCKKYEDIRDANYSEQIIYMPAAVEGNSISGIYRINAVAVQGQVFRYVADVAASKLNIPLSVYRSGVDTKGSIDVTIAANIDTVNKLIVANKFPAVTELLPADKYSLSATSVNIADGEGYKGFTLALDLNFLLANLTKKYAIAVTVSSNQKAAGSFSTTVVYIDPAFLVPVANFTRTIATRTVSFSNTSLNSNAWSWNYGDGSPASTEKALSYTYAASGTYTITLTAKGALGNLNPSTFSSIVIIP